MAGLDTTFFYAIYGLTGRYSTLDFLGVFSAKYLIMLEVAGLVLFLAALYFLKKRWKGALAMLYRAFAAATLAFGGNFLFSLFCMRPRPFYGLEGVESLIDIPFASKSMPSDHAAIAFAIAVSVMFTRPRLGALLVLCAVLISFGRVYAGVHFPSDVLVGAMVGTIWAFAVRALDRNIPGGFLRSVSSAPADPGSVKGQKI